MHIYHILWRNGRYRMHKITVTRETDTHFIRPGPIALSLIPKTRASRRKREAARLLAELEA
jgi:hypothetical protein